MATSIAASLSGTLGARHRCLNALVRDAHQHGTPLPSSHTAGEAPADRLFAIDLASKQLNLEYILLSLKDDDMLYVSRALKSLWLLEPEYYHIINPESLKQDLFPQMRLQAVNKMKHWIHLHLRDTKRCEEFYRSYKDTEFNTAAKFLCHCSNEFILGEITNILDKITPKHLKVLSEKVPAVTKIYFDSLQDHPDLLQNYIFDGSKYFAHVKYLLKSDADVFFYVLEHFFNLGQYSPFSSEITKYIMKNHKNRFTEKQELYTAKFLNMDALAKCLDSQEAKELVVKLAKAEYLADWFAYKTVEPLIKRLNKDDRKSFKKFIFVDKAFGLTVKEWPYAIPTVPGLILPQKGLFEDVEIKTNCYSYEYLSNIEDICAKNFDLKCKFLRQAFCESALPVRTLLNELFDKYRFSNYKETLVELRQKLRAESSAQNRQYMLLVLVSKSGGRSEDLISLLELMSQYKNEPVQIRAAIVRSLVKRAFVWRLAPEHWAKLVQWGHGLGLDGSPPEAACKEGLHAVVIRDMLAGVTSSELVLKTFFEDFSDFSNYSLTTDERSCIRARLPALLLAAAQSDPNQALARLNLLLDTLAAYRIRFDEFPGTVETIAAAAQRNFKSAIPLLTRVYKAGVARKLLIKENFEMIQTDASYLNALRHDVSILEKTTKFEELISKKHPRFPNFTRKLALFFNEKDGLGEQYRAVFEKRATATPDIKLARPLALLASFTFPSLLKVFDGANPKTPQRQFAAALRANAHVVRPAFDLESFGWRAAGSKAVANHVATCRQIDVERYLPQTLSWRRTLRLALILAKRIGKDRDAYEVFVSKRPGAALSCALRYFYVEGDKSDLRIWDIVKVHILKLSRDKLRRTIENIGTPFNTVSKRQSNYLAEYLVLIYKACKENLPELQRSILSKMPEVLPEIDEQFVFEEVDYFLRTYLTSESHSFILQKKNYNYDKTASVFLYIGILAKFLMLCTSEKMLEERFQRVGMPFLKCFELMWKQASEKDMNSMETNFDSFLLHLRYNKVYFDVKYVSCLPVFEKLTQWMHGILPIDKWFDKYVAVHLTMIYFKTVRLCIEQNPKLFTDETQKLKEGPKVLGTIFGEFINNEVVDLVNKYFPSIIELYKAEVTDYLRKYFSQYYSDKSVHNFVVAVVYALLMKDSVASCILAKHIFSEFKHVLGSDNVKDILKRFKENRTEELCFGIDDDDDDVRLF